jgi:hypothetical protein
MDGSISGGDAVPEMTFEEWRDDAKATHSDGESA